jgi:hypothetical protein
MTGVSRYVGTQLPMQWSARNTEQRTSVFTDTILERKLLEREKQAATGKRFLVSLYWFLLITGEKEWKKHLTLSLLVRHSIK